MLTILNELSEEASRPATNTFDLDVFKLIYVTLAIVQEIVGNFSECLKTFSVKVGELIK